MYESRVLTNPIEQSRKEKEKKEECLKNLSKTSFYFIISRCALLEDKKTKKRQNVVKKAGKERNSKMRVKLGEKYNSES